jgi:hypothetical protein
VGNKKIPNSTAERYHSGQPWGLGQTVHVPQGCLEISAPIDNAPDGDRQVQTLEVLSRSFNVFTRFLPPIIIFLIGLPMRLCTNRYFAATVGRKSGV